MRFAHIIPALSVALLATGIIYTAPIVYVKNNSNRLIDIVLMAGNKEFPMGLIKAEDEGSIEAFGFNSPLTGLRIKYCPASYGGTGCNNPEGVMKVGTSSKYEEKRPLDYFGKTDEFEFTDPDAKKYYLKVTIDKKDHVSLIPQVGKAGFTSGKHKYSLRNNIKESKIAWSSRVSPLSTNTPTSFDPTGIPVSHKKTTPVNVAPSSTITRTPPVAPSSTITRTPIPVTDEE